MYQVNQVVKGTKCGFFKILALRSMHGEEGVQVKEVNPAHFNETRSGELWLPLSALADNSNAIDTQAVRKESGVVAEQVAVSKIDATTETTADGGPRYYIGHLKELNGEREYSHVIRFMAGDPARYIDDIASRFYDEDGAELDGDGYYFDDMTLFVKPTGYQEISRELYVQLHGIVTGL